MQLRCKSLLRGQQQETSFWTFQKNTPCYNNIVFYFSTLFLPLIPTILTVFMTQNKLWSSSSGIQQSSHCKMTTTSNSLEKENFNNSINMLYVLLQSIYGLKKKLQNLKINTSMRVHESTLIHWLCGLLQTHYKDKIKGSGNCRVSCNNMASMHISYVLARPAQ